MIWKNSNSSDIDEEIIKQLNTPKTFDMEPRKAIPKKDFVLEEEINLIVHYRISNTNYLPS